MATPRPRSRDCALPENCLCTSFHGAERHDGPVCDVTPCISFDLMVTLPWQIPRAPPHGWRPIWTHEGSACEFQNNFGAALAMGTSRTLLVFGHRVVHPCTRRIFPH